MNFVQRETGGGRSKSEQKMKTETYLNSKDAILNLFIVKFTNLSFLQQIFPFNVMYDFQFGLRFITLITIVQCLCTNAQPINLIFFLLSCRIQR